MNRLVIFEVKQLKIENGTTHFSIATDAFISRWIYSFDMSNENVFMRCILVSGKEKNYMLIVQKKLYLLYIYEDRLKNNYTELLQTEQMIGKIWKKWIRYIRKVVPDSLT
jgi:hypothetical protein